MKFVVGAVLFFLSVAGRAEVWRGLEVEPENRCSPYDRSDYRYSPDLEPSILEQMGGGPIRCSYTGQTYDSFRETDIEHVVATSEAHDSGLCAASDEMRRQFAGDLLNLTLSDPAVNRFEKRAQDAGEWMPRINRVWFAETVVAVKLKYGLTINPVERDSLAFVLGASQTETAVKFRTWATLKAAVRSLFKKIARRD